jgi:alkaline phosphatase
VLRNRSFVVTDVVFRTGALGLLGVEPANAMVTDSAAAASAMATGHKVNNDSVSVTPDGKPVGTIMDAAKAAGKRIGLVTTAAVYDASPAAMATHEKSRREAQHIVDRLLALEPDVLMGGGRDYFVPKGMPGGRRLDGNDAMTAFAARGYDIVRDAHGLAFARGPRLLGLFADEDMDFEIDRDPKRQPSMAEMLGAALRVLSADSPRGFVLFVENENIDSAGHRNDAAALIRDLWAFDDAARVALDYQRRAPGETLVIVAGDHETGGLSITYALKDLSSGGSRNRFYASDAHLRMVSRIDISLRAAASLLGSKPTPQALDALIAQHFPGFHLDPDLRAAILERRRIERNVGFVVEGALSRMIARQTAFYWGTGGHTTEPVVVGALGPGAEAFRGYRVNTDFGKALLELIR